jgi:hypothetical protein
VKVDFTTCSFARVATVARTLLRAVRRGAPWADFEARAEALQVIEEIEHRDRAARANSLGSVARVAPFGRSWSVSGSTAERGG